MRRFVGLGLLVGLLVMAACAAQEKVAPAPAAPAPPAPEAKPAWQEEWERVLAAAKRESRVVVAGPPGADERRALTEPFERKYGIGVEFQGFAGPDLSPRLRAERDAGQFLWDVWVGGTTTMITALRPMGAMDPIEPALILPEVKDPKNWLEGRLFFFEKDRLGLAMLPRTRETMFINPTLVQPEEIRSYKDLLNPKWKGKLVVGMDPRVAGPGQATWTLFYLHPELGPDFIRALARQELALLRDNIQAAQWLAQGRYPIALGISPREARNMIDQGLPIKLVDPRQLKEGADLSSGAGNIGLFSRAPHPNAAKVYINWLLSKEGQTIASKAWGYPSWRADVPTDHLEPWAKPLPGSVDTFTEKAMEAKDPLLKLLYELYGR